MTRLSLILACLLIAAPAAAGPRASGPDLTGLWTSTSLTELERPKGFASLTVSDAEAAAYERRRPEEFRHPADDDEVGARSSESDYWDPGAKLARIGGQARTSWIVDPADGHLPWKPEGQAARRREAAEHSGFANPENRTASERCLISGWAGAGPPMMNAPYANQYQIVQTRDVVAIALESIHDVRMIRIVARPSGGVAPASLHLPAQLRPWMGDSVGWWEGRTLVVETTNFNPGDALKLPTSLFVSKDARVVERFTRLGAGTLRYDFTVDDPATYARPWRAEMVFQASKGPMLEYACHEGNRSMLGILAGARREEAEAGKSPPAK